jgi:hypothetical protein
MPEQALRRLFLIERSLRLQTRGLLSGDFQQKVGWTMSILFSKLQGSFFSQTAAFCAVGLCVSFVAVIVYDLRIADVWI